MKNKSVNTGHSLIVNTPDQKNRAGDLARKVEGV